MANRTPFGLALSAQREAIRQGQRTVEQGMNAQQSMTEAFVHNSIGMGRAANRNATEATRQGVVTVVGMMDAMNPVGVNTRPSVEQGFDSMATVQDNAWRIFEESFKDGLAAYAQFAQSGRNAFSQSMDATLAAHREVEQRSTDAAVEYERQRPEVHATGGRGRGESGTGETTTDTSAGAEPVEIEPEEVEEPSIESGETAAETGEPASEAGGAVTEEAEPVAEAGEPAMGPVLEDLSGVGSAYAERLRSAGIDSVEALLEADVAALSEETEISDERLANWQRQVRHMIDEGE